MVWDDDLPEDHGITSAEATMSLMTAIIGAGIMVLPQLPKVGGTVVSATLMVVSTAATIEAGSALFRATMANNIALQHGVKATQTYIHSWEDFGYAAYGRPGAALIQVLTIGWFIGLNSGYVILIAQSLQSLLKPFFFLSFTVWIFIVGPCLWFVSMMRDVSAIAKVVPLGVGAAVASCILITAKACMDTPVWEDWTSEEKAQLHNVWPMGGALSLGSLLATIFGAVGCLPNVPSILDEMKNKHAFKRSFRTALTSVMVLYLGIMMMGYHAYGNFIQPSIVVSMRDHPATFAESQFEPSEWTGATTNILPTAMSCFVLVNLVISYPLNLAPVFISIQGTTYGKEYMKVGSKKNYLMRTAIVLVTVAIPLVVSDFALVYSLFASISGPVQGVLIPIVFGYKIRKKVGAANSGILRLAWHGALGALAVFCVVFGLIDSSRAIVESFR